MPERALSPCKNPAVQTWYAGAATARIISRRSMRGSASISERAEDTGAETVLQLAGVDVCE